jgi:hypothetical protein
MTENGALRCSLRNKQGPTRRVMSAAISVRRSIFANNANAASTPLLCRPAPAYISLLTTKEGAMREQINADLKQAMKAGDKQRVGTLRLINAAIKSADIDARPSGKDKISDDAILGVLSKMIKQRRDSIVQYTSGGRQDLADKELAEVKIIEVYLPKQMDEAETKKAVADVIKEVGAESPKDIGKVMGALKHRFAGQMDFGKASAAAKELLK